MNNFLKKLPGILVGIAIVIVLLNMAEFSWRELAEKIIDGGFILFVAMILGTGTLYIATTYKWKVIVDDLKQGPKVPFGYLYHYTSFGYMLSLGLSLVVSDIGYRSLQLNNRHGISFKDSTYSVLLGHFFTLLVSLLLLLPGMVFFFISSNGWLTCGVLVVELLVSGVIFFYWNGKILNFAAWGYAFLVNSVQKLPFFKRPTSAAVLTACDFSLTQVAARKAFLGALFCHFFMAVRLYAIIWALDLEINWLVLLLGNSMLIFLGLIAFIPGQLGLIEISWYGLMLQAGIPEADIVTFVISSRVFSNLAIIVTGCLSWVGVSVFLNSNRDKISKNEESFGEANS